MSTTERLAAFLMKHSGSFQVARDPVMNVLTLHLICQRKTGEVLNITRALTVEDIVRSNINRFDFETDRMLDILEKEL